MSPLTDWRRTVSDTDSKEHDGDSDDLWPMGAVTRRLGISEHTLRAWERSFGFPKPVRLPSGHRRYTSDQVRQLQLINRVLRCSSDLHAQGCVNKPVAISPGTNQTYGWVGLLNMRSNHRR
jgi:predicted DNA-binding transcriptional regulator AlpA